MTSEIPIDDIKTKKSRADATPDPQDIFSLSDRNHHLVLQSTTLIRSLLQKSFASTASDLQTLQCSDLKLRNLYERSKNGNQPGYVIVSKLFTNLDLNNPVFSVYQRCGANKLFLILIPDLVFISKFINFNQC